MYDWLHLHTFYSAADNIPRAQFPMPCALLKRYLQVFGFFVFYLLFLLFVFVFFFAVFVELVLAKDSGCVRSNNFESSPDRSPFVIRCDYSVQEYKESGRREIVVSQLFCQA